MSQKKKLTIALKSVLNKELHIVSYIPLSGGDINAVYKVDTDIGSFCIKQNVKSHFPEMFQKEANGLKELCKSSFRIPGVTGTYEDDNYQHLILEFIESSMRSSDFRDIFGKKLAEMHRHTNDEFGLYENNYIGSLRQSNRKHDTWGDFYASERILPQIRLAYDQDRISEEIVRKSERLCQQLNEFFPIEPPALLHGDLWSGNVITDDQGAPVLIDPAVYYGHREMDLGMMKLFGGFDETVFQSYDRHYPLDKGWQKRIPLTQLYPLLVHVNLFGGGYVNSATSIIRQFS